MSKRAAPADIQSGTVSKRSKTAARLASVKAMSATKNLKRILVIGLAGHAPGRPAPSSGKLPRGHFRRGLKATTAEARKSGLELEMMQIKPSAFSSGLLDIRKKLETHPEGLVIGYGIRGTPEYTAFFEDLVNASLEITPSTQLAFNTSPNDILECCLRNFCRKT